MARILWAFLIFQVQIYSQNVEKIPRSGYFLVPSAFLPLYQVINKLFEMDFSIANGGYYFNDFFTYYFILSPPL